jgi:hypothetical protein
MILTTRLPRWLVVVLLTTALAAVTAGLLLAPRLLYPPLPAADLQAVTDPRSRIELQQAQSRLANDARSGFLQALAGLLVAVGAVATWRQVHISREGQITERFTRAVDQLGNQNVDVRIGGIYALERIAKNSTSDRDPIQFLLGAFIRNHASWPVGTAGGPEHPTATVDTSLPWMRVRAPDIQAVMGVLGRCAPSPNPQVVYLSRVDLRSVALRGARLTGAQLRYSNLARAVLAGVHLDGSDLTGADLRRAHLERTIFTKANLSRAYLQGADLRGTDLRGADLRGADLSGATLDHAILTGAQADATTTWPATLDQERRRELGVTEVSGTEPR